MMFSCQHHNSWHDTLLLLASPTHVVHLLRRGASVALLCLGRSGYFRRLALMALYSRAVLEHGSDICSYKMEQCVGCLETHFFVSITTRNNALVHIPMYSSHRPVIFSPCTCFCDNRTHCAPWLCPVSGCHRHWHKYHKLSWYPLCCSPSGYVQWDITSLPLGPNHARSGNLRWAAPQPPQTLSGVQNATTQPSECYQAPMGNSPGNPLNAISKRAVSESEDCLFLRCVLSCLHERSKRRVLVYTLRVMLSLLSTREDSLSSFGSTVEGMFVPPIIYDHQCVTSSMEIHLRCPVPIQRCRLDCGIQSRSHCGNHPISPWFIWLLGWRGG